MSTISEQFTRKFAPNCIDVKALSPDRQAEFKTLGILPIAAVLTDRVKEQVNKEITKHSLYYGSPGLGKSAVARVRLGVDVNNKSYPSSKYHTLFVNCSKDGRIDDLRNKIESFCTTTSVTDDGKLREKVVLFDEIDGVSPAFFDGLRGFIDVYEKNVKFLATCNYINRVPPAIRSRFDPCINFNPISEAETKELFDKYCKRLKAVWVHMLKRECTDEAIYQLARKTVPDIRSGLQSLQTLFETTTGPMTIDEIVSGTTNFRDLYDFIMTAPSDEEIHKFVGIRYADKGYEILNSIHTQLVDYILEKYPTHKALIGSINIMSAEYLHASINGVDPFVCVKACLYRLVQIIRK